MTEPLTEEDRRCENCVHWERYAADDDWECVKCAQGDNAPYFKSMKAELEKQCERCSVGAGMCDSRCWLKGAADDCPRAKELLDENT